MNNVKIYINSTSQDTESKWGVIFTETSVTALMTPPPLKSYITNTNPLSDGIQSLRDSENIPKVDERDITLVFGLHAKNLAQFIIRYFNFCNELKKGALDLTMHIVEDDTYLKCTYHLNYMSCTQYSEYNGRVGKFTVKFNEPNPEDRDIEYSSNIIL